MSPSDNSANTSQFPGELRNSKQVYDINNPKCHSTGWLKGFFCSLVKKYSRVVICISDGTYNHAVTYFAKKSNSETRTIRYGVHIRGYYFLTTVSESILRSLWTKELLLNELTLTKLSWW